MINKMQKCLNELLILGTDDWVSVWDLQGVVFKIGHEREPEGQRELALQLVKLALREEWMEIGNVKGKFIPWKITPEKAAEEINKIWMKYTDPSDMMGEF